jgi:hypothetical protein
VVPVHDTLLDGDRRERRRVDIVGNAAEDLIRAWHDHPASRRSGGDDADPDEEDRGTDQTHAADSMEDPGVGSATGRESDRELPEIVLR